MNNQKEFVFIGGSRDGTIMCVSNPTQIVRLPVDQPKLLWDASVSPSYSKFRYENYLKKHVEFVVKPTHGHFGTVAVLCELDYYLHAELADINGIQTLLSQALKQVLNL